MLSLNLTLLVMMVLFLTFAWLMNMVFFGPVSRILDQRREYISKQQADASASLQQVADLQAAYESRLKTAHGQAQDVIQAAMKDAEGKRQAMIDQISGQIAQDLAAARADIQAERQKAMGQLQGEVSQFTELIKRKVMGSSPAYSANQPQA